MFGIAPLHVIINLVIGFLSLALLIRVVLLWFRMDERYAFVRFLASITDPFILPIRRIVGGRIMLLDLSYFIAFFLLSTLGILLNQSLPAAW